MEPQKEGEGKRRRMRLWCPETPEIKQEGMPAMLNATERSDTTKG
jgi:hypothetical protein